ncbi:MAG: porin [Rhodospirillales bacterium]|nr:porin [Rhodospirillales bacterium]
MRHTRQLLAIVASGALALPMTTVVQAGEATLYGSLRTGVIMHNPDDDGDTTWDIGSRGDSLSSRAGIKASHELDGGMTVGARIEKKLGTWGTRLQYASVSADGFGTLSVGQQWTTFYNATTIDGAYFFGGNSDVIFRSNGVQYSSDFGGPFNFSAMVGDNNSASEEKVGDNATAQGDGMDVVQLSGTLGVGGVNLSVGWMDNDEVAEDIGVRASGSFGPLGYKIGGGTREMEDGTDIDRFGAFASYAVMEGGTLYAEYEDIDSDNDADDNDHLVLGYAHNPAPGFTVIAEFMTPDSGTDKGTVALKVDF